MADECAHDQWERDEHGRCHGCGRLFPDIIADLRAQVAAKQERIDDLLSQASDAEGLFKLEEARAQRLEELIAYWEEQAEQTLNWRQTRGMKTATDVSMFASCAQSAVIKFLRDIRFARDAALARQEETKTCRGCGHPDGGCGYDCECVAEFHVRRWQEAGE